MAGIETKGVPVSPAPGMVLFSARPMTLMPGGFIRSARFNPGKLQCLYCCMSGMCCGGTAGAVQRTYLDVYTDRIEMNVPFACSFCYGCCCNRTYDNVQTVHYDRDLLIRPVEKAGCCKPTFHLCGMAHGCGRCGDVMYLTAPCCGSVNTVNAPGNFIQAPNGMTGCCIMCAILMFGPLSIPLWGALCCPAYFTCGLEEGEAEMLAVTITNASRGRLMQ